MPSNVRTTLFAVPKLYFRLYVPLRTVAATFSAKRSYWASTSRRLCNGCCLPLLLPGKHRTVTNPCSGDANGTSHSAFADVYRVSTLTNGRADAGFAYV